MFKLFNSTLLIIFVLMTIGCNGQSGDTNGQKINPIKNGVENLQMKSCSPKKVKSILGNARYVLSQSSAEQKKIILWDAFTQKIIKKMNFSFRYSEISSDGSYLIRKISRRRFHIMNIFDSEINYNERISVTSSKKLKINFSQDGKYILTSYKSFASKYKVSIYDIEKRRMIFSGHYSNLKYFLMNDYNHIVIVQTNYRNENNLIYLDLSQKTHSEFKVKKGEIQDVVMTNSVISIKIKNTINNYKVQSQILLNSGPSIQVIDTDISEDMALGFNNKGELKLISLWKGGPEKNIKVSNNINVSSCKLNYLEDSIICLDKFDPNKVNILSISLEKTIQVCL